MRLTMKERQSLTKVTAERYRRVGKKEKGRILDEFVHATGYHRTYAGSVLRLSAQEIRLRGRVRVKADRTKRSRRKRSRIYGEEVFPALRQIWEIMNYMCGKRLEAVLTEVIAKLEHYGELSLDEETRQKLHHISASTIDRLLRPERKKLQIKGRSGTKPGTLLKHQIPVRTFSEWDEGVPGFLEADLVGHDGGDSGGDYIQSLNAVDVCTGWTETVALRNKAQVWTFHGLQEIRERLPFELLGLDSDNGSEFINDQLFRYCRDEKITFTRSRPYRKNDSCHVEQKNYTAVRQYAGYVRYDTEKELDLLNELYGTLRLYLNFFHPTAKITSKERVGSKVKKRYEKPVTPYQRVLASLPIRKKTKITLKRLYGRLNPAELKRTIERIQEQLWKMTVKKRKKTVPIPKKTQPQNRKQPHFSVKEFISGDA